MFSRTYSPLPAWPILGAATIVFIAPMPSQLRWAWVGVLVSGYVVGPVAARILASRAMRVVDAPTHERRLTASDPQASATQTES